MPPPPLHIPGHAQQEHPHRRSCSSASPSMNQTGGAASAQREAADGAVEGGGEGPAATGTD